MTKTLVQHESVSYRDVSGTSTGSTQVVVAANQQRRGFLIQNISDTAMHINFGATATAGAGSILLASAGGIWIAPVNGVPTTAINLICASPSKAFTAKEW